MHSISARWWVWFVVVLVAPFVLVVGSYELALFAPGTVRTEVWEDAGAVLFLAAIPGVAYVLYRARISWVRRILILAPCVYVLAMGAFTLQAQWHCGEAKAKYIGEPTRTVSAEDSSCT
jgi:hypothetical protein